MGEVRRGFARGLSLRCTHHATRLARAAFSPPRLASNIEGNCPFSPTLPWFLELCVNRALQNLFVISRYLKKMPVDIKYDFRQLHAFAIALRCHYFRFDRHSQRFVNPDQLFTIADVFL